MKLAIFSRTPLAAAPWELFKAIKKYTDINVVYINKTHRYMDGRYFPFHMLLNHSSGAALQALANADVWHIHNYLIPELKSVHRGQPVIAQFHSLPRQGNWEELIDFADISYTIDQPLHVREYKMPGLPNLIDPDEYFPIRKDDSKIKIAFAPSSTAPIGMPQSKGYYEVKKILNEVSHEREGGVEIMWIEGQDYNTNLGMKQHSHILIDDVVTGNWHRTSLEGCSFGCAVLNKIHMKPFLQADLASLKSKLLMLVDHPKILRKHQMAARHWVLSEWHAMDLVNKYVEVYKGVKRVQSKTS